MPSTATRFFPSSGLPEDMHAANAPNSSAKARHWHRRSNDVMNALALNTSFTPFTAPPRTKEDGTWANRQTISATAKGTAPEDQDTRNFGNAVPRTALNQGTIAATAANLKKVDMRQKGQKARNDGAKPNAPSKQNQARGR